MKASPRIIMMNPVLATCTPKGRKRKIRINYAGPRTLHLVLGV